MYRTAEDSHVSLKEASFMNALTKLTTPETKKSNS